MLPVTEATEQRDGYCLGALITDVLVGAVAAVLIIALAMSLGGFSFFVPWIIVTVPVMSAAGVLRGNSRGNIWLKSLSISVACLLFAALLGDAETFSLGLLFAAVLLLITVLATAGGIAVRRHRLHRSEDTSL